MTISYSFSFDYLTRLLRFTVRRHPLWLANLLLVSFSVLMELGALAILMPLSQLAVGGQISPDSRWGRLFATFGITFTMTTAVLYFIAVYSARLLTQFAGQAAAVHVGKRVQAELSSSAFERIVKDAPLQEIDQKSSGHFISLAGDETARAGQIIIAINQLIEATLLTAIYFAALFYVSAWLGAGVTVFLVVVALSLRGTLKRSQALSSRQLVESKAAHSIFLDALNGLRSVRAMSAESFVTERYAHIIHGYTRTHFLIDTLGFAAKLVPALILLLAIGAAAGLGVLELSSAAALSTVVTALAFLLRFLPTAGQALSAFMKLLNDLRSASDVTRLLEQPHASEILGGSVAPARPVESIELRAVCFSYSATTPVLQNFSARFRRGRSYAIVGPSGSGKTTLFDLLLRFYAADFGEVLFDGIPVPQLDRHQLKGAVVLVGQQVTILNDTVANNIRFGATASDAEMQAACAAACIDSVIMAMPQGYDTIMAFQGNNLSGGQRQRIALARGLLRQPDVLLLDESTTGLDAQTKEQVVTNILSSYRERIVIFSTHDPHLVARVDEVIQLVRLSSVQNSSEEASPREDTEPAHVAGAQ